MPLGSNDNKQYGAPDFERYYAGQMTAQEMHALEKAALDDPFLADALEGYKLTRTPVADVAWLKEQLQGKTRRVKVVPLVPKKNFPILRIAALVLLLAGAGWGVHSLMDHRSDRLALEQKQESAPVVQKTPEAVVVTDTASKTIQPLKEESAATPAPPTATLPRRSAKKPVIRTEERATVTAAAAPVTEVKDADSGQPMLLRRADARDVTAVQRKAEVLPPALEGRVAGVQLQEVAAANTFQGRVVDANNQGVPNATVSLRNNRTGVTTDVAGNFSLNATDSTVKATVSAVGFESQNITLSRQQEKNDIVLQPNDQGLNEVVVVGYGKKKRGPLARSRHTEAPAPAQGWDHFEDYLQKNRKPASALSPKGLKGGVVLTFEVNRKGAPTDIKVDSSLSPQYDAEAVRLLREGPKWKRPKEARGKVTIHFP